MNTIASELHHVSMHPVDVHVAPQTENRNRLTTGFRIILAIPHLLLVGAPAAFAFSWGVGPEDSPRLEWTGPGVLGAVAAVCARPPSVQPIVRPQTPHVHCAGKFL